MSEKPVLQARIVFANGTADPNLYTPYQAQSIIDASAYAQEAGARVQTRRSVNDEWVDVKSTGSRGLASLTYKKHGDSRKPITAELRLTDLDGVGLIADLDEHQLASLLSGSVVGVEIGGTL